MKYSMLSLIFVSTVSLAQPYSNLMSGNDPVRSGTNLCWRSGVWTPATAHPDCDGADLKPRAKPAPAPAPVAVVPPAPPPAPVKPTAAVVVTKVNLQTDALFDFDKSVIKPEGRARLDQFVKQLSGISYQFVVVVGHTDSIGSDDYNMKLGHRRAEAVKAYLVSQGIRQPIQVSSRGEKEPIADNRTASGRAKNRRVVIEVTGTR
jgi:OOP family OmpA-OmpF porin